MLRIAHGFVAHGLDANFSYYIDQAFMSYRHYELDHMRNYLCNSELHVIINNQHERRYALLRRVLKEDDYQMLVHLERIKEFSV